MRATTPAAEILNRVERAGLTLRVKAGVLYVGPAARLTEPLRASIAKNKPALLEGLEQRQAFIDAMTEAFPGSTVELGTGDVQ
jgi:hypothetical protein